MGGTNENLTTPKDASAGPEQASTNTKEFKLCGCRGTEGFVHGYIHAGAAKFPATVFSKTAGRLLVTEMLKANLLDAGDENVLIQQIEASNLPDDLPGSAEAVSQGLSEFALGAILGMAILGIGTKDDRGDLLGELPIDPGPQATAPSPR